MKALILAAGYATRLYPLTRNFPKPLLEVGGRTILDRLTDQIIAAAPDSEIWLATNARFARLCMSSMTAPVDQKNGLERSATFSC